MDNETGTESMVSHRRERARRRNRDEGTVAVPAQIWTPNFLWYPLVEIPTWYFYPLWPQSPCIKLDMHRPSSL